MTIFNSLHISASGLSLERLKLDTISSNIANVNTTRTEEGGPYQKKTVVFEEAFKESVQTIEMGTSRKSFGVRATELVADDAEVREYDPTHPDADAEGYVLKSNVNMSDEMIDLMAAVRAYESNITSLEAGKDMLKQALTISSK